MSLYRRGLQSALRPHVGAWVYTPGYGADLIKQLDGDIKTVDREVSQWLDDHDALRPHTADAPISEEMLPLARFYEGTWSDFLRRWEDFMGDKASWWRRLWGSTWDTIQSYRADLIRLRTAWEKMGVNFNAPAPAPPEQSGFSAMWSTLKTILIIGAAIIGGIFVIWGIGQLRGSFASPQPVRYLPA